MSLHRYLYANASPISLVDPSGRFTMSSVLATVSVSNILAAHAQPGLKKGKAQAFLYLKNFIGDDPSSEYFLQIIDIYNSMYADALNSLKAWLKSNGVAVFEPSTPGEITSRMKDATTNAILAHSDLVDFDTKKDIDFIYSSYKRKGKLYEIDRSTTISFSALNSSTIDGGRTFVSACCPIPKP